MKLKSVFGYEYSLKSMKVGDFDFSTIRDLDESIDVLCAYFGEGEEDLSLAEAHCPYFGVMWEAGIGLAQHLTKEMCEGKKIIEIGCGLALPSFVATKFGASVLATDFHADVPLFLEMNQKRNNIHFDYHKMNWRDEVSRVKEQVGLHDLVIGSDILYESQHPHQVAEALISFLNEKGKIILADPGRAYMQKFVSAMNDLGYKETLKSQIVKAELTPKNRQREVYIFEFNNQ
jgi:predicted nicotinamide N-methyase